MAERTWALQLLVFQSVRRPRRRRGAPGPRAVRPPTSGPPRTLYFAQPALYVTGYGGFVGWVKAVRPTTATLRAMLLALREVGAERTADLFSQALAVLPGQRIPAPGWIDPEWLRALAPERADAFAQIDRTFRRDYCDLRRALLAYAAAHVEAIRASRAVRASRRASTNDA